MWQQVPRAVFRTKNSRNMLFHGWVFIFSSEKIDCLESATNDEVDFFHKYTIDVSTNSNRNHTKYIYFRMLINFYFAYISYTVGSPKKLLFLPRSPKKTRTQRLPDLYWNTSNPMWVFHFLFPFSCSNLLGSERMWPTVHIYFKNSIKKLFS